MRATSITGILAMFAFSACAVGPDFVRPELGDLPTSYREAPPGMARATDGELSSWWNELSDPTLVALLTEAAAANLSAQQAESRLREARALQRSTAAAIFPTLDASASYEKGGTESSDDEDVGVVGDATGTARAVGTRELFQGGFDAAWEIDLFGGTRRAVEAGEARSQAALEDARDVFVSLSGDVAAEYLALRLSQERERIALENLRRQEQSLEIAERRRSSGFASGLDVANARAEAASTRAGLSELRVEQKHALYSIAVILGRAPESPPPELLVRGEIPAFPGRVLADVPSDLLRRRPDVRRAEALLHAATADVGVAEADLFPRFSLTGSFRAQGTTFSSAADGDTRVWSFGPAMRWPLFDGGRLRAERDASDERRWQALLAYRETVLAALRDVETALVQLAEDEARSVALEEAANESRRAFELASELYRSGLGSFLDVLTAERTLFAAEDRLASQRQARLVHLVALYKALGGGWSPETPSEERAHEP